MRLLFLPLLLPQELGYQKDEAKKKFQQGNHFGAMSVSSRETRDSSRNHTIPPIISHHIHPPFFVITSPINEWQNWRAGSHLPTLIIRAG